MSDEKSESENVSKSEEEVSESPLVATEKLKVIEDIEVQMAVEVGRTELTIKELLRLNEGSVVELDRMAGDHLDIFVNGTIIAKGEVVMVGERFGIRFLEIVDPEKRAQTL